MVKEDLNMKYCVVGAGAMGAAFSIPLLDNGHSVTLTEPYNFKLLQKLNSKISKKYATFSKYIDKKYNLFKVC